MQIDTMICLASKQSMANVLPVLQMRPERVYILATPEEFTSANNLKTLFAGKGVMAEIIPNLNAYDVSTVRAAAVSILNRNGSSNAVVNITGGTKLMALAAYEAARTQGFAVIYCNTRDRVLMNIYPGAPDIPLKVDVSMEDYLASYGYLVKDYKAPGDYEGLFSVLRQGALETFCKATSLFRKHFNNPSARTRKKFGQFSVVKEYDTYYLNYGTGRLIFENKKFIMGDWLEYYVHDHIRRNISEKAMVGVNILSAADVKNEVDVVFMFNDQLHFVSCKSGSGRQLDLFQLEGIRTLAGGTFGKAYFISGEAISPEDYRRGEELHIKMGQVTNLSTVFSGSL
jgi:hypothetical protein